VKPGLQTQMKSGSGSPIGVTVGIHVPPDKHGLFKHESGKKQLTFTSGLQHSLVKMLHNRQLVSEHTQL
jgi:hypothetical protein